jgi:hypothetical protein
MRDTLALVREIPGVLRDLVVDAWRWWKLRRVRKHCWHHDDKTGQSWVNSRLINTGAGKMFWCSRCEKTEFI